MNEESNYLTGYVGVIDVLGFSNYSMDLSNFEKILYMTNLELVFKKNFESMFDHIKFCILSDTVVVMIKADEYKKFDYSFFLSVIDNIGRIRSYILKSVGLYSRASVTFGEYYFDLKQNIIFGPAISRAAKLAEKSEKFFPNSELFKDSPSAIIVDDVFLKQNSENYNKFLDGGIVHLIKINKMFKRIERTNFYFYNPYFEDFEDYSLTSSNEVSCSNGDMLNNYIFRERERLRYASSLENGKYKDKYKVEEQCLNDFETFESKKFGF